VDDPTVPELAERLARAELAERLAKRLAGLDRDTERVFLCPHEGGIDAWSHAIVADVPCYQEMPWPFRS